jgi:hypothetical protein
MNRHPDLDSTDERLREWAFFYRDRKSQSRCKSIEHRFRATSDDFAAEGWGDMESAPSVRPGRSYSTLRADQTEDAIRELERIYRWALTYGYCYPHLPRFVVLRCMRKFTGRRLNWQAYLELLDIGRFRIHTTISCANLLTAQNF